MKYVDNRAKKEINNIKLQDTFSAKLKVPRYAP